MTHEACSRHSMRNALLGLVLAIGLALAMSPLTIGGIAAWKIVLAAFGAVLVVTAGRGEKVRPTRPPG
jgi:hypothetical protein